MCIVLLARQKFLDLDDELQKYIPEIPQYSQPITIRHLIPIYADTYTDKFEFVQDQEGRVVGLYRCNDRVRKLYFSKPYCLLNKSTRRS
jgi:CubicO group peptidase (beta-lactamase class C family)